MFVGGVGRICKQYDNKVALKALIENSPVFVLPAVPSIPTISPLLIELNILAYPFPFQSAFDA